MAAFAPQVGKPQKGCPIRLLEFDKTNPRLLNGNNYETSSDEDIISALNEIAPLGEILTSICTNTYLDFEPLIVMGPSSGPFKVLEGNRRLASIKLINDRELAKRCRISLPSNISSAVIDSIQEVTIWLVKNEDDARSFIGFKHINGPARWDAYAKAKFVYNWYKKADGSITIDDISEQLGDDNDTIRAYISSIYVLDQAEELKLFDIKNRYNSGRFAFSHLYTALGRVEFQEFLGLEKGWNKGLVENPVPRASEEKLKEFLGYLYGNKANETPSLIKSQNPDLKHIGQCLDNPTSLAMLRSGTSLSIAYNEVRTPYDVFSEVLAQANLKLKSVLDVIQKYQGEESLLIIADDIVEQADILRDVMKKKYKGLIKPSPENTEK